MKPLRNENVITSFLDRLIENYGFTFNQSKFHYICEHEFYSYLCLKNKYGEDVISVMVMANDILNNIVFCVNYDLRSDGTFWKHSKFEFELSKMDLLAVENFIKEIKK